MHLSSKLSRLALAFALPLLVGCHDTAPIGPGVVDTAPGEDLADDTTPPPDDTVAPADFFIPDVPPVDTTSSDGTVSGDTDPGVCNSFGCPCARNSDCLDGLCIEGLDGGVCTRPCVAECPAGFDCLLSTAFGTDPLSICVPQHTRLCRPCRSNDECQSGNDPFPAYCVPAADPNDGSFCASSCAARGCPDGYSCEDVALAEGGTARQCMPTDGTCECRDSWSDFGYSTACAITNAFGTCGGARYCDEGGLTACEGPLASPEICDGEDNDCNGTPDDITPFPCPITNAFGTCQGVTVCQAGSPDPVCSGREASTELCNDIDDNCNAATDEAGCDDNLSCTTDTCVGGGNCQHTLNPGACLIAGACWSNNQYNPQSACQQCNTSQSTTAWTQAPNTCIIGGQCYPNGAVNPANGCQICNPNQNAAGWTTSANTCTIGGQCYLANESNPSNPCEICVPFTSTTAWTQASNTCNIQGQCYAAGVRRPGQPCFVCDPSRNPTGWSAAFAGTSCDDGSPCSTNDACNGAGVCAGDTSCNDGIACTKDICGAGGCDNSQVEDNWCRINGTCYTQGFQNPSNQCQACLPTTTQASRTVWSNRPSTAVCNDGNACTLEDRCSGTGTCLAGAAKNCSDGLSCTTDTCNTSTGVCSSGLITGNCLISGGCYANGTTEPNNVCRRCTTSSSTSVWSLNNGATCNDGNNCTSNDTCSNNVCAGTNVVDGYEPNNSSAAATNMGNHRDADSFPQRTLQNSTFFGANDEDWFTYFIDDVIAGDIEPRVEVSGIPTGTVYEACIWFRCTNEDAVPSELNCPSGTRTDISVGGKTYRGCCRSATGPNVLNHRIDGSDFDCPTADDDFRAYVRVRNLSSTWSCNNNYTINIGDD
jgi:hypothetical protein